MASSRVSLDGFPALFTRDQLVARGATRHVLQRLRSQRVINELLPEVYARAELDVTWEHGVEAVVRWGGSDVVFSHATAAALHGLKGFERAGTIHVSARGTPKAPPTHGLELVIHGKRDFDRWDVEPRDGRMITRVERTLLDVAPDLDDRAFERLVADALKRRLTKAHRLRACLHRLEHRRERGLRELRALFHRRGWTLTRLESQLEENFAKLFLAQKLPPPTEQYEWPEKGAPVYRIDFAWPGQKLAVEADSYFHHSSEEDWANDQTRMNALVSEGWSVMRFTAEDLARPRKTAHLILTALYGRDWIDSGA
jgi:hypothetical protein